MRLLTAIPAPPIDNLEFGPLTLHLYGLCIGIGMVVAITLAEHLLRRRGVPLGNFYAVVIPAVIMGFVGSRIYHVLSEPRRYADAPGDIVQVWNGGLGIYGAVIGGALTAWVLARRRGFPLGELLDAAAVGFPIAQAIGRVGNWVNQELFGGPTGLPWRLEVDALHRPARYADDCCFHPTFAYEGLANLVLATGLFVTHRRWGARPVGVLFALYVAGYSAIRVFVEELRVDEAHEWFGLRQNQWVALVLVIGGLAVAAALVRRQRRRGDAAASAASMDVREDRHY